jgi:opacity protein-like surface antigen
VHHDIALSALHYGHMLGDRVGADHWYGGNFEIMAEAFGGAQYYRESRYLFGATAVMRYNLMTGTRWVPFMDVGIGGALTNIKQPDLGSLGEFNGQIGPGVMYFWCENVALTAQYRYLHMSSGGLSSPNQGVNENIAYLGISWFF